MNHLTTSEIFQIVDETLANGARTRIVAHLEVCPRCRQEVAVRQTKSNVHQCFLMLPKRTWTITHEQENSS
ncbi:MAG: zf-HC2 domain-containing protein [Ignavibacteriales bacterium]|nr:zf-HC2 domain-containing protein [Ignavibacteriales bacterium]